MALSDFFSALELTPVGIAVLESSWLFPTIETVHVLAITLVFGSIALLDLRLLRVHARDLGVLQMTRETLPWTWGAFTFAVISGGLLFVSSATRYVDNTAFLWKMTLLVLAGINMAIFHFTVFRRVEDWNHSSPTPPAARIAATLSLIFWIGVVVFGRWIGFT